MIALDLNYIPCRSFSGSVDANNIQSLDFLGCRSIQGRCEEGIQRFGKEVASR